VTEGKGIEDAVAAVMAANAQLGKTVFSLDIFGPIDGDFRDTFSALQKSFPAYIVYRGEVPYDKSVETLRSFFALLFPTRFYTEGIPGTVIDAYAAGVPVIASRWESFSDVVEDGQTGIGYAFGDREALVSVLLSVAAEPERINDLKTACLQKARAFCPEEAMVSLLQQME
jgi:glycosyltransferase involved in cell wall biosynthesis